MAGFSGKKDCGQIRRRLAEALGSPLTIGAGWARRHLADCPECRRRALGSARLRVALLLMKTQPHRADLLSMANRQAIGVLKHGLRGLPKARALGQTVPRPSLRKSLDKYARPMVHAAACLIVLLLVRTGVFSAMMRVEHEGREVAQRYYARHLGEQSPEDTL